MGTPNVIYSVFSDEFMNKIETYCGPPYSFCSLAVGVNIHQSIINSTITSHNKPQTDNQSQQSHQSWRRIL